MTDTYFEVPRFDDEDDDPLNPSEDKWTLALDLFTSGHTGDAVCDALGIRRSTFRRRAAGSGQHIISTGAVTRYAKLDTHPARLGALTTA